MVLLNQFLIVWLLTLNILPTTISSEHIRDDSALGWWEGHQVRICFYIILAAFRFSFAAQAPCAHAGSCSSRTCFFVSGGDSMIDYDTGNCALGFIWRCHGSVFLRALMWALPSSLAVVAIISIVAELDYEFEHDVVQNLNVLWSSFQVLLGFLVVFRTQQAGMYRAGLCRFVPEENPRRKNRAGLCRKTNPCHYIRAGPRRNKIRARKFVSVVP